VPRLQVWAIDRRSQPLEDTSMFAQLEAGEASLQEMFDYYLGWITNGGQPVDHFRFLNPTTVPFAREWGMETALEDARGVVELARSKGRKVVLGGHSLGASLAAAYAAWDFDGRPGYKDLAGIVLIDGGLLGTFDAYDLAQAQAAIAELEVSNPFLDLLGLGLVEVAGIFAEIAGTTRGWRRPRAPRRCRISAASRSLRSGLPVTNRALLGHAFDRDTSPPELSCCT
jgi:pimeloyl-ACP methyl ester carboxylesterase